MLMEGGILQDKREGIGEMEKSEREEETRRVKGTTNERRREG
jgi:hypothetical protein